MAAIIEVARRGQVTIPKPLRDMYGIEQGSKYTVRALEGGSLLLTPSGGRANAALDKLRSLLVEEGATLQAMLEQLRRMREDPIQDDGS